MTASRTATETADDADDVDEQRAAVRQNAVGADRVEGGPTTDETTASPTPSGTMTDRWKGISAVALVAGGVGLVLREPGLVLAAAIGVGYLAYVRVAAADGRRNRPELSVERSYPADPDPGEETTVQTRVRNAGDRWLADVRLVDGVPEALPVVDGSPRRAVSLRPGETTTIEYAVRAKRGEHAFEPLEAVVRDVAGGSEQRVSVETEDRVVSTPSTAAVEELPLQPQTTPYAGRVETSEGGEGLEFYATREYRRGDALSRIDWNRHARTGELSTVEFRQERAATVVLVLDLRSEAYLREDDTGLHAADRGVEAASRVFTSLIETGDRVGVTALSPEEVWLAPNSGNDHWARARELFATHPALSSAATEGRTSVRLELRRLRRRLPDDAQVVFFSPLCDDSSLRAARMLHAYGYPVTVVSPDPTADDTPGQRLAAAERTARMTDLRGHGVRVVDWGPEDRLSTVIDRARRRWSR